MVFSDASLGNVVNGGSQGGFIIFISDDNHALPILWSSKRLKRVVRITLAAEALAPNEAIDNAVFVQNLVFDILRERLDIVCFTDNRDLTVATSSSKDVSEKRLRTEIMAIKDSIQNSSVQIQWVDTKTSCRYSYKRWRVQSTDFLTFWKLHPFFFHLDLKEAIHQKSGRD